MPWPQNSRVDQPPGLTASAPTASADASPWQRLARDACYIVLVTTGWLAGNLLGILGCVVAVFLVISHGDMSMFFLHIDNLASRYVAADVGRRTVFEHQMVQILAGVFVIAILVRGPVFVARVRRELRQGRLV